VVIIWYYVYVIVFNLQIYLEIIKFCGSPKCCNSIYLNLNSLCARLDVRRYVIELAMCVSCGVYLK
jgi:hypothetical protein